MAERDFLMIAAAPGANVDTQVDYAGSGYQELGFQPGITLSDEFNKGFRQGTAGMAVIAQFIINQLNQDVLDSGYADEAAEVAALANQFQAALSAFLSFTATPQVIPVAYSANPTYDASLGNPVVVNFQISLTGNTAGMTLANIKPGQLVTFIIKQDSVGGHTFTWAGTVINPGAPDPAANSSSQQTFIVDSASNLQPISGMVG